MNKPAVVPAATSASPSREQPARRSWRLWLYGLIMLVPLAYAGWRYPLRGHSTELVDIGKLSNYHVTEFVWYTAGLVVLFICYGLALLEARRLSLRRAWPAVVVCSAAFAGVMAWMYPVNAIDIFIYAARSRLFTHYGVNPIAVTPATYCANLINPAAVHCADPYMRYASGEWASKVSPYGPLWNLIAAPATWIGGDKIGAALAGYKVLAVLAYALCGAIVAITLNATRRAEVAAGCLVFLWNPLVLWEGIGNGHNDVVLMVPLLLALWAWRTRRNKLVIPLIIVSVLIKYVTVLVLPLAVIALWRRAGDWRTRFRWALWSAGLSIIAAVISFAPFYSLSNLRAIRHSVNSQGNIFLTSPAAMAIGLLHTRYSFADLERWTKLGGEIIVILFLAWQLVSLWEVPDRLTRAMLEILFIFLLVATWNFRPWYLIWLVAVTALLPLGWPAGRVLAWTAGGLAMYSLFIWGWAWWKVDFYTVQDVAVPLILGGTLLVSLAELITRGRRWWRTRTKAGRLAPIESASRGDGPGGTPLRSE